MRLHILDEDEGAVSVGTATADGGVMSSISGINTSVGSGIVNYGPNNPYLSNLAAYKRRKKNIRDDIYEKEYKKKDTKQAGHSRKNVGKNKFNNKFHTPKGW